MIREFEDLLSFTEHLLRAQVILHEAAGKSLKVALKVLEKDMRQQIGEYQDAIGPYPEWAPLAESTEEEKARLGFPANAPLERTGALEDSFTHEREGDEGEVGSTDPKMVFHEYGTVKMPPRPVVGPAWERNRARIEARIGRALVAAIAGNRLLTEHGPDENGHDD